MQRRLLMAGLSYGAALAALAQTRAPDAPPPAPAAEPAQRVEVVGERQNDLAERRQSTAAKIIIGREEIERFGDSSLGEMIKRLPGITMDGRPGRGGNIRMRGLGGGYTQILLDGERVQGGLSLDSIDPEQVERIEILRAPTAETGARAIAGTINIITREGFRKRLNDLKLGAGYENDHTGGNVSWTRDDKLSETLSYNLSLSLFGFERGDQSQTHTVSSTLDQTEFFDSSSHRVGLHANGRLQWRLGGGGTLMLMPMFISSEGGGVARSRCATSCGLVNASDPSLPPDATTAYARSQTDSSSRFSLARLNGQWRATLGQGARLEMQGGVGRSTSHGHSLRNQFDAAGNRSGGREDASESTENTAQLKGKISTLLEGDHSLVSGWELETARRLDTQTSTALPAFDGNFQAQTERYAAFAQDEWNLNPNWAAHAGLRWEGIHTQGEAESGAKPSNRSSVWTPLLHAVWKPDPKGRDQVRWSLTRSYRSPSLSDLMGRPSVSVRYPVSGPNTATNPDRDGNPALKPELATGLDMAYEHYLSGSGLLGANVFYRRIRDLMRTVIGPAPESVAWSPVPRWVARPQNVGNASTQGVELEARVKLSEVWETAPALELRANASVFRSRVDSVSGPDNRLGQQPSGTANLGADYKLPGLPLTLGGNLNWTPGYTTRLSETQWAVQGRKRVVDAYALWQISPWARLRLTGSNLAPEDALNVSTVSGESASTTAQTFMNWRLQLELRL